MPLKSKKAKLHLGCGGKYFKGWVNADITGKTADRRFDFNKKFPFPDNYFDEVYCCHVLEHLDNVEHAMDEIWRVCSKGAKVTIKVPHFSCMAAANPFHKHSFNSLGMLFLITNLKEKYGKEIFKIKSTRIFWYPSMEEPTYDKYVSQKPYRIVCSFIGKIIDLFINLNRQFFERIWCYYVGGAFEIKWVLEVVK